MRGRVSLRPDLDPKGLFPSSSEARDAVKRVVPATLENYLCCNHIVEAAFELLVENRADVSAHFGTSGRFLEAPGAPENQTAFRAPASFGRRLGCRLRDLSNCAKSFAKHGLEWRVW